jgi:hypothetical protein
VANSPSKITRSTSLADLLATVVAGGTYSEVIETAKTDAPGQEAAAADISEYGGEIWSNLVDDSVQRVVQMYDRGTKVWLPADAAARDAIGSDDDLEADALCMLADTKAMYYCVSVDGAAASTWAALPATGSVSGPGLSTDLAVARWDGAGGATIQNSVVIISDLGAISGVTDITLSGTIDGRNVSADGTTLDAHVASIANPHSTLLSQVLDADARTNGFSIEITNGDEINGEDGGYVRFAAATGIVQTSDLATAGDTSATGMVTSGEGLAIAERAATPFTAAGYSTVWTKNTIPTTLWTTDDAGNDYQIATGSTAALANVLVVGAETGGTDIIVSSGDSIVGEDGVAGPGGALPIIAGAGDGAEVGGTASLAGGEGGATGAGGTCSITGGTGGATSGAGGNTTVQGGDATNGVSAGGTLALAGGQPAGAGAPGAVTVTAAGAISGNVIGGAVTVDAGDGAGTQAGGAVTCTAGSGGLTGAGGLASLAGGAGGGTSGAGGGGYVVGGAGTAGNGAGGEAAVLGGASNGSGTGGTARVQAGAGGTTGTGGLARFRGGAGGSGAATGGAVEITSGAGGATSGNSGAVTISSGTVTSGTRGTITLDGSDVIVANPGYHSVRGATARGAVNTLVYRWTSVIDNVGTDITYADSANSGGSWTINNAGVYAVSVSIDVNHAGYIAIKKAAAAVSNTFDATDIQIAAEAAAGITTQMAWTGYCSVNDFIWIATSSATNPTGAPVNNNRVTVTRVR